MGRRAVVPARHGEPKLKLASWVQLEIARQIAQASGKDLDQLMEQARSRDFKAVPLPIKVKATMHSLIRPFDSQNVLAMLPGSDPKLKDQAVIYSAHYDHLGIHPGEKGDNIYNGAVDNATGSAVLIEMARAFSLSAQKPKRSILFASVTGEEQGLRGSEFLGLHPPIPAGDLTLGLNFDGVAPEGIPENRRSVGRRAHHVLSGGGRDGAQLRNADQSRLESWSRVLLSLRPFQLCARRHSCFLRERRDEVQRPSGRVGRGAGEDLQREALPPAKRRVRQQTGTSPALRI